MIIIDKEYFIDSDGMNWILNKHTNRFDKYNKELIATIGYPNSIEKALSMVLKIKQQSYAHENDVTLKEYFDESVRLKNELQELLLTIKDMSDVS